MKNWFKYILITTVFMFIGFSGVGAKTCNYDDGKNAVTITTNYTNMGTANALITKFNGKTIKNNETLKNADSNSWTESNCPKYVLVKYKKGINGASVWGTDSEKEAKKIATSKKISTKNYAIISTDDTSNVSSAASGVKDADLTCAYQTNNGTITCAISDGDSFSTCSVNATSTTLGSNAKLPIHNFYDDNKLTCPKALYYEASAGANGTVYNNFSTSKSNKNIAAKLIEKTDDVKISTENKIYCPYGDLVLTIDTSKKTVSGTNQNCDKVQLKFDYDDYNSASKNKYNCFTKIYKQRNYSNQNKTCIYSLKDESTTALPYDKIEFDTYSDAVDASGNALISHNIDTTKAEIDYADSCDDAGETIKLLKQVYTLLRYLIPVIIIGLGIVDFIKVVATGEDKAFKEVWSKFVKRIIIGIVILILPAILSLIINLSGITDTYGVDPNNIFCILK